MVVFLTQGCIHYYNVIVKQYQIECSSAVPVMYLTIRKSFYYLTVSRFRQEVQGYGHEMRRYFQQKRAMKIKAP